MSGESKRQHVGLSLGTGGYWMARTINRCATEAGVGDQWQFGVVDSASISDDDLPAEFGLVQLQRDDRMRQIFEQLRDQHAVPWLHDSLALANQGATRDPRIGRFYVEYHSHHIYRQLKSMIESAVDENEHDELTVWLCSSFAGGTGAGAFPLVSVLVSEIVSDIATDAEIDARVLGVGCISELTLPQRTVPGPNAVYYLNSNVMLHELATLLDLDTATGSGSAYPLEIEMEAAPEPTQASALRTNTRRLEEPPLDALFLTPIDEQRADSSSRSDDETASYIEEVNWSIAMAVLACAHVDEGLENFFEETLVDDLYTFDTADVRVPIDAAEQYFETSDELAQLDDDIESTAATIERLESVSERHKSLYEAALGGAPDPEAVGALSSAVSSSFDDARRRIDAMSLPDAGAETLSREASAFADRVAPDDDSVVDHELLAVYAFYRLAHAELEDRIESSAFARRVFELRSENSDQLGEYSRVDSDDPLEVFEGAVEPYLIDSLHALDDDIESTNGARFRKVRKLRSRRAEIESTLEAVRDARDRHESLVATVETLQTQCLADVRRRLDDRIESIAATLETHRNSLKEMKKRRSDCETKLERITETLTTGSNGRIATVPFELDSLDDLSRETVESADHLYDLVDVGVLDEETIAEHVRRAFEDELSEPLEDTVVENTTPGELLAPLSHRRNTSVLDDRSVETARQGHDIRTQLSVSGFELPFTISLVTFFDNVTLEHASEFRHITERWRDGTLEALFAEDIDLTAQVAYPELFDPADPPVALSEDVAVGAEVSPGALVEDGGEE